jgi:hypothetical protein
MGQSVATLPTRRSNAIRNVPPFALVAVALLGLALETNDTNTDNRRGVWLVGGCAAFGVAASLVYSLLERDQQRALRVRLAAWTAIRLFLAFELTHYGFAKVVGMQFYPRYYQLDTRTSELAPMALAWTFFGRSYGYQAISGLMEMAAAVLLCFRRTTTLGGCLALAVLANVVLVNFFYDVPVKLFSSIFMAMTCYVLALDADRFWTFFFGDESVAPRTYLTAPKASLGARDSAARTILVLLVVGLPTADIANKAVQRRIFTRDVLEGAWTVDASFGVDGLLSAAPGQWRNLYFEKGDYGSVRVGRQRVRFLMRVDQSAHTLRISKFDGEPSLTLDGTFGLTDRKVHFEGSLDGRAFWIDMTRDFPR